MDSGRKKYIGFINKKGTNWVFRFWKCECGMQGSNQTIKARPTWIDEWIRNTVDVRLRSPNMTLIDKATAKGLETI